MIAIVQMLLSIPEFVQHFYDLEFSKKNQFSGLVHLLARTVFSERPDLAEIDTLRKLSEKEFPLYRQHDACKYMLHLFENLQNELNPSAPHFVSSGYENYAEAWMEYSTKHNSIIDELFVGMHETVIKCNRCTEETRTYEEFTNIPLAIEKDESGDKVLKFFEEQKEIVSFKYYCSSCDLTTPCTIYNRICKAPKFLMLSIQRFDQATLKKINDDLFYRDIEELKYMDEELRIILLGMV